MRLPSHDCLRCGASCQGLRVRVTPAERASIVANAQSLGIDRPLDGDHLRQNWGRCVFHAEGCRLHRTFGRASKPSVCQQFPRLPGAIDPACFHPGPPAGPAASVDWTSLGDGEQVARWLDAMVLPALLDGPTLGPEVAARLTPLIGARPAVVPRAHRAALAVHFATLRDHDLVPQADPVAAAHGGAQLLVGASALDAFPAWIRLLKLGLFGCRA